MKTIVPILTISILLSSCFNQKVIFCEAQHHELKGEMLSYGEFPTDCGIQAVALAVEFEVLAYSDKCFTKDTIVVIFNCPDFLGEEYFIVGNIYNLMIRIENDNDSMFDLYNHRALERNHQDEKLYAVLE